MGKFRPRGSTGRRLVGHAVKRGIKAAKRQQGAKSNISHTNDTYEEVSCSTMAVILFLFIIIITVIAWIIN